MERIPPQNLEAEQSLLGSMIMDNEVIYDVLEILSPSHFYDPRHRDVYTAIAKLTRENSPVDLVTLSEKLRKAKKLKQVGGRPYLTDLVLAVTTSSHVLKYAEIIKEKASRRSLIEMSSQVSEMGFDDNTPLIDVVGKAESMLYEVAESSKKTEIDLIADYEEYKKLYREGAQKGLLGLSTGLPSLDKATFGLIPGHVWVAGGFYATGKSYLGLNIISNLILANKRCLMFTIEMSCNETIQRLISLRARVGLLDTLYPRSGVDTSLLQLGESETLTALQEGHLSLDHHSRNLDQIIYEIRKACRTNKPDFVLVDYLQLIDSQGDDYEMLSRAAKTFQSLAQEYGFTILLLSQISNQAQKEGLDSQTDGFKGAGEIGAVANVGIRILRERDPNDKSRYTNDYILACRKIRHNSAQTLDFKIDFPGGVIREVNTLEAAGIAQTFEQL